MWEYFSHKSPKYFTRGKITYIYYTGLSLFCEGTSMVAIFDKDAVSSTDPTDVRLIDENCVGQAYGDSQIAIQTDYNKCGTTMEVGTYTVMSRM